MNVCMLTSGGDSQGMNACLCELAKLLKRSKHKVYVSLCGYQGLVRDQVRKVSSKEFENISHLGGSVIKSFRCPEFKQKEGFNKALLTIKKYKIDAVIAIGGDGTFRGASSLAKKGIKVFGIPGTIDNDLTYTDFTLGFDSAVNNAVNFIDGVKETLASANRIGLFEVMGRHCDDIAVYTGYATNADQVILSKEEFNYESLLEKLRALVWEGVESPCVVIRENVLDLYALADRLQNDLKTEVRANVLGYLQRGGSPSVNDRILARKFADFAVEQLNKGICNVAIGVVDDKAISVPIELAHIINNRRPNEILSFLPR